MLSWGFLLGLILVDWRLSLMTLFLSGLIGTVVVLPFMLKQKKKGSSGLQTKLPFGPFLIVSALICLLVWRVFNRLVYNFCQRRIAVF